MLRRLAIVLIVACLFLPRIGGAASPEVVTVDVDGVIHPVTVEIVSGALELAARDHAQLVLIRLNTPGGLMDAMRETIEKIVAAPVPVITYVTPSGGRAASAGFFILEAGDVAAMAPGTNTGAAHPVLIGGAPMDAVMKQKVENDAAALLRSIVSKRGRNAELAQKAVYESKSFTDNEALDGHLIDLTARNDEDLISKLNGREITRFNGQKKRLELTGARTVEYHRNLRQRILSAIADPNVALALLVLGALGIYVEFSSPGLIFPGVAGAILALLGLSALSVLPINWAGAALIVLAFVLFILEAKFASHGILAIGGTVAMILGSLLLINSPIPAMRIHLSTALALALPFAAITTLLLSLVLRARANKVVTGYEAMVGRTGIAITDLAPEGKVFVNGEYWNAVSSKPLHAGAKVRVTAAQELTLKVEPAGESGPEVPAR